MCNQLRGLCPWARSVRPRRFPRICKTTGFDGGDDGDRVMMMMMMVVVMVMAMNMAAICIYPSSPKIEIGAVIPRGSDYIKWVKFKNGDYIFIIHLEGVAMARSSTKISKQWKKIRGYSPRWELAVKRHREASIHQDITTRKHKDKETLVRHGTKTEKHTGQGGKWSSVIDFWLKHSPTWEVTNAYIAMFIQVWTWCLLQR